MRLTTDQQAHGCTDRCQCLNNVGEGCENYNCFGRKLAVTLSLCGAFPGIRCRAHTVSVSHCKAGLLLNTQPIFSGRLELSMWQSIKCHSRIYFTFPFELDYSKLHLHMKMFPLFCAVIKLLFHKHHCSIDLNFAGIQTVKKKCFLNAVSGVFWSGWTAHFLSHYEKSKLSWPLWFYSIWFYRKCILMTSLFMSPSCWNASSSSKSWLS